MPRQARIANRQQCPAPARCRVTAFPAGRRDDIEPLSCGRFRLPCRYRSRRPVRRRPRSSRAACLAAIIPLPPSLAAHERAWPPQECGPTGTDSAMTPKRRCRFLTTLTIRIEYLASVSVWSLLTPRGLVQTLQQALGQFIAIGRSILKGVAYDDSMCFTLPFEGAWKVYNGGVTKQTSHSWYLIGQRYAYDFVVCDTRGHTHHGASHRPDSYLAFGRPVLAAADGTVVDARNDVKDHHRAGTGWVDIATPDIRGNYVVIEHRNHTYTLYAHLKSGSITVKKGESVAAGQKIAECGHSGHSSEPHLHFQLQDRADFHSAVSLPIRFSNIERVKNGIRECVARGCVERDHVVRNDKTCSSGVIETASFATPGAADLVISCVILLLTVLGIVVIAARVVEMILYVRSRF